MTWIVPKPLHTSAFVPDTAALTLDLNEQSQICEQSLLVRSKPSPARTWLRKWKRDTWTQHLCGRILRPSLGASFTEKYTSSLAAIPANPLAQPESGSERTTQDTSGPSLQMELGSCDPSFASLRTLKDTLALDSEKSLETWKASVMQQRGDYSARLKLARLTSESASSSWPTAKARDWKDTTNCSLDAVNPDGTHRDRRDRLVGAIAAEMSGPVAQANSSTDGSHPESLVDWRTPQANEAGARVETLFTKNGQPARPGERAYRKTPSGKMVLQSQTINQQVEMVQSLDKSNWATPCSRDHHPNGMAIGSKTDLGNQAKSWATPQSRDWRSAEGQQQRWDNPERSQNLNDQMTAWATPIVGDSHLASTPDVAAKRLAEGKVTLSRQNAGKLNPRWVETLMGLPVGWTMPSCACPATIAPMSCDFSATALCQPAQSELFAP